ncbi:MAG TPA: hypothetical protein VNV35_04795, partial [Puia sp.]|nr:hypothetical protein [Puia sp.]
MGSRRYHTNGIILIALLAGALPGAAQSYHFDTVISRAVLDNYLSRSISMEGLLNGRGDFDDNIRMLDHTGAKFVGRSICLWGGEAQLLTNFARAKTEVPRVLADDHDRILEACIF